MALKVRYDGDPKKVYLRMIKNWSKARTRHFHHKGAHSRRVRKIMMNRGDKKC